MFNVFFLENAPWIFWKSCQAERPTGMLKVFVFSHIAGDHLDDLSCLKQDAETLIIGSTVVGNDRDALCLHRGDASREGARK